MTPLSWGVWVAPMHAHTHANSCPHGVGHLQFKLACVYNGVCVHAWCVCEHEHVWVTPIPPPTRPGGCQITKIESTVELIKIIWFCLMIYHLWRLPTYVDYGWWTGRGVAHPTYVLGPKKVNIFQFSYWIPINCLDWLLVSIWTSQPIYSPFKSDHKWWQVRNLTLMLILPWNCQSQKFLN